MIDTIMPIITDRRFIAACLFVSFILVGVVVHHYTKE